MTAYHPRLLEPIVRRCAAYFKVVLILGARQVGKTTLLRHLFPSLKLITFDPIQDAYQAKSDPDAFLDTFPPPLILDEVQYVPALLAAIKRRVDLNPMMGQYFLTGSQNLNVLRSTAESMAGRVGILQLDGFTTRELVGSGAEPDGWLRTYLERPDELTTLLSATTQEPVDSLARILWRGSMPGMLNIPDEAAALFFQSYVQTYVEREVRLVENIQELSEFGRFLGLLGALTGQEINSTQLGRDIGVSPLTARRWLNLVSNTYQWRELLPYHGNSIKRISGKKKGYLSDTGIACYLQRIPTPEALLNSPIMGHVFETWVVNAIHRQFPIVGLAPYAYHWRTTAGGAEVDLILERDGQLYPIEIKCKTNLTAHDLSGLKAFRHTYPQARIMPGLLIYAGREVYRVDKDTIAIPWRAV